MDAFRTLVFLASVRRSVGARECDALCSSLLFDWSEAPGPGAYDFEKTVEGVAPFGVREGCDELVQECLFLDDVTMMNARIGADGDAFPTYPNPGHPSHPSLAEVLENGFIMYDAHSSMYIAGIGEYHGPSGA